MPRPRITLRVMLDVMTIAAVAAWQLSTVLQRKWALKSVHVLILSPTPIELGDFLNGINGLRRRSAAA